MERKGGLLPVMTLPTAKPAAPAKVVPVPEPPPVPAISTTQLEELFAEVRVYKSTVDDLRAIVVALQLQVVQSQLRFAPSQSLQFPTRDNTTTMSAVAIRDAVRNSTTLEEIYGDIGDEENAHCALDRDLPVRAVGLVRLSVTSPVLAVFGPPRRSRWQAFMQAFLISTQCSFVATQSEDDAGFTIGLNLTTTHASAAVFRFGYHLDFDGYYELWTAFAYLAGYGFLNIFIVGRLDDIDITCYDNVVYVDNALGGVPTQGCTLRQRFAELIGLARIIRDHLQEHNAGRLIEYKLGYPLEGVHDSASFGASVVIDSPSVLSPRPLADNIVLLHLHDKLKAVSVTTDAGLCFLAAFQAGLCSKPAPPAIRGTLAGMARAVYQQHISDTPMSDPDKVHLTLIANVQAQLAASVK